MTNWTKEDDLTTKYGSGQRGYGLTTMDGRTLTTQSGVELTREGVTSDYTGEADSKTPWGEVEDIITNYTKVEDE